MLKIRLKRVGRKNDPSFRMVVVDSRRGPKSNRFIERLGFYNPKTKERVVNSERVQYWIGVGAQASGTAYNMLVDVGVLTGKKKNVLPQKSPVVKEQPTTNDKQPTTAEVEKEESDVEEIPAEESKESETPTQEKEQVGETIEQKERPASHVEETLGEQKES